MDQDYKGLTSKEAAERLAKYGPNRLDRPPAYSVGALLLSQFTSPLMLVLLGAMGLTWLMGDLVDAAVIFLAIGVNGSLGFWQEYRAEKSLQALSQVLTREAIAIRDGESVRIPQEQIVKGDLVVMSGGERLAADGVVFRADQLKVNEAILTGEAVPVAKKALSGRMEAAAAWTAVGERGQKDGSMSVYAGTAVTQGEGLMVVVNTGMATEVGAIAAELVKSERSKTPLQLRLSDLGRNLSLGVLAIAVGLILVGIVQGRDWYEMVSVSVAVAVAAIPEGMAVSLTAILAVGMQRILKRKALVRKLLAAEVLGSVSVIGVDKTGTLTEGEMRVAEVEAVDRRLMAAAAATATGGADQLETAFKEWGLKQMTESQTRTLSRDFTVIQRHPFVVEKRYSLTLTKKTVFLMGAPETVISLVQGSPVTKQRWLNEVKQKAALGYRMVAVASRPNRDEDRINSRTLAKRWQWLGLVVYEDRVRPGLKKVFNQVEAAGISLKVITGDFKETAEAVLRRVGIPLTEEQVAVGDELTELEPEALERKVGETVLFARTTPVQKLMIVKALQNSGEVVAMTGDGVNDAPALKRADVGIVVSGAAEVARETADMVLLDDNFATIVAAVEEGRGMYKNLKKVILYLLADSLTQVILVVGSLLAGWPLILTTVQVLWVNLVTDSLPALALTVDPHVLELLNQPPRKKSEPIVNYEMKLLMAIISLTTGLMVMAMFAWQWLVWGWSLEKAQTFAFSLTAAACLLVAFPARSMQTPLYKDIWWRNPWLLLAVGAGIGLQLMVVYVPAIQQMMGTTALAMADWVWIGGLCVIVVGLVEGAKYFFWRRR